MKASLPCVLLLACSVVPRAVDPDSWFAAAGMRVFARVACRVNGDEHVLAVGGRPAEAGHLALFTKSGERVQARTLGDDVAYAVAAVASGTRAAVALADGEVCTLSLPDLVPEHRWRHGKPAVAVAFSPDGAWLASGGYDGLLLVGALDAAKPVVLEQTAPVTSVAFAADGLHVLAGTRDGRVRLHERSGRLVCSWNRLGGEVLAIEWRDGAGHCLLRGAPGEPPRRHPLSMP